MTELHTGTDKLLGRVHGPVAVLSFNRPESRNALSDEIYDGFNTALPQVAQRDDIRVLMVTGEGGAFCSGGDVKGFRASHAGEGESMTPEESLDRLRRNQMWISGAFRKLPKPVVAAIPGPAAGAGFSIALAADFRVATESAIFVSAFSTIGASGDFGSSWFLPRLIGEAKAKEFMFLRLGSLRVRLSTLVSLTACLLMPSLMTLQWLSATNLQHAHRSLCACRRKISSVHSMPMLLPHSTPKQPPW